MKLVEEGQLDPDCEMAEMLKDTCFPLPEAIIHGYVRVCVKMEENGWLSLVKESRLDPISQRGPTIQPMKYFVSVQ